MNKALLAAEAADKAMEELKQAYESASLHRNRSSNQQLKPIQAITARKPPETSPTTSEI